jgi:hypothetical protein
MSATATPRIGRLALVLPVEMANDWPAIVAELGAMVNAERYQLLSEPNQWIRTDGPLALPVLHVEVDITTAGP